MPPPPASLVEDARSALLFRLADHHEGEVLGLHVLGRHALHVVQRHRLEKGVAVLDIVGAQPVLPERQQVAGDLRVAVEAQREGAGQIGLGVRQFLLRRAFRAQLADIFATRRTTSSALSFIVELEPVQRQKCGWMSRLGADAIGQARFSRMSSVSRDENPPPPRM